MKNLRLNKILWGTVTLLALVASIYGLIDGSIYTGLFPLAFIAAQFSQDILTIIVCLILAALIFTTPENDLKRPTIIIGMIGSLAYLYGIFSIERVYNVMYLVYLGILSTSFYSVIYSIASLDYELVSKVEVNRTVKYSTAIFSLIIAGLFSFLWISALLPLMAAKNQIQNLYSIYLLDLAFIMPAFVITAVMTFLKKPLGYVLTPAIYILGIFVIFPLGLGELAKPLYGLAADTKSMTMSFALAGLFFMGALVQLYQMKWNK
jgi:hypothetical protein